MFIPQTVDKRPAVPAPVNTAAAAKLITSSQAAGKLGFHVGPGSPAVQAPIATATTAATSAGILPAKKPPISRGVPPPVPPNKPVVPPKKEAAYLRRTELSQTTQQDNTAKFGKQATSHVTAASGAVASLQTQQPLANAAQATDEEVSKTTTESR